MCPVCLLQVAAAVLPRPRTTSATRAPAMQPAASTAGAGAGTSQVMVVQEQIPGWKRHWRDMQAKVGCRLRACRLRACWTPPLVTPPVQVQTLQIKLCCRPHASNDCSSCCATCSG